VDVVNQAQNRDRHHALVRAAMKLTVAKMQGISLLGEKLLAFQEGLCSMELVG